MRKDTDGQSGGDERGAWSRRVPSAGTPVPVELGHHPGTWMCSPTWKLSKPFAFEILWNLPHVGMINYYLHSWPSPLSREVRDRAKNFSL